MLEIKKTESIQVDEKGMTLVTEGQTVFLSWGVIDKIAELSEPHYFSAAITEFTGMISQKKILN